MKFKRWTTLLQNQAVAVILLLLVLVPMLFGLDQTQRANQLTAYGFLGLILLSVWLFRVRDGITIARVRGFLLSGPNLPIVLYLVWGGITTAFSSEPLYSRFGLVQLAVGVVFYAVTVYQFRRREHVRALLSTVLAVGVVMVLLAMGMDRGRHLQDLAGSFHDRQLFGAFLSMILPVTLGIAAGTRRKLWKLSAGIACVLIAGALLMTTCRSSWMGVVTALGLFLAMSLVFVWKVQSPSGDKRGLLHRKHELFVTPLIGLLAIGVFVGFTSTSNPISSRANTFSSLAKDDSVQDRMKLWGIATRVIQGSPIVGWGPGSYAFAQQKFNPESRARTIIEQLGPSLSESPHNTYLHIAAEQGLVGLGLFLAILVLFFYRGIKALPRIDRGLRQFTLVGCLSAMAGICVDAVANPAYMYPEISTFMWLILGMGMCAAGLGQEVEPEASRVFDAPILGLPRFLYRGMRTALLACAVVWLGAQLLNLDVLAAASAGTGSGWKPARVAASPYRPTYCDQITHLELDWQNDQIKPTAAFNINAGAIYENRLAEFKVFAATDDIRFFADVTHEIKHLKFKVRGMKGKFIYQRSSNEPIIYFKPAAKMGGKTGSIDFSYRCTQPKVTYTTRFVLTILPSGEPIDESATTRRLGAAIGDGRSVSFLDTLPGLFALPTDDEGSDSKTDFDETLSD